MGDSRSIVAEHGVQHRLSIKTLIALLFLTLTILAADQALLRIPDQSLEGPAVASLRAEPVDSDPSAFGGLRLAGAWRLRSDDPRFGGFSALAVEDGMLVALSDSGMVARFARPGASPAGVRLAPLPAGPGDPGFKRNRDSEAILRDPQGRGWWVAFEHHHQLWLFDPRFERALARRPLPSDGWTVNAGVEAMAAADGALLLFHETRPEILRTSGGPFAGVPLAGSIATISDAASLGNGDILLFERRRSLTGFGNRLLRVRRDGAGYRLVGAQRLGLGPLDIAEGMAVEPLPGGRARLWLITDDNFQRPFRTLLVALDLPSAGNDAV